MANMANLKTLVMMQLKDKLDLSFTKSKRSMLFKIAAVVGEVVLSGGAFFLFFFLASILKLFSFSGQVPESLVTAMFTFIFTLAVISCTVGLTNTLYLTADNRVLLTLPVQPNIVFLSKFVLYFIFELRKNAMLLLPMYVAYGIVSGAVWYYYPWLLVCYVLVSLLPVAIGAVLSLPALFVSDFVKRFKWLQVILIIAVTALVGWGVLTLIGYMPENINIAGRWGSISLGMQNALDKFAKWVWPLNAINLMIMGGAAEIRSNLFTINTLWGMLITVGTVGVSIAFAYILARPLFFKMASKQFEFEKMVTPPKLNKKHNGKLSPFVYEVKRSFRSSRFVIQQLVSLLVLPIAIYLLNKTYAAMNTRLTGQYMTIAFSLLICLLIITSDNVSYAAAYSVDGAARPIAKTQPVSAQLALSARLVVRALVILISTVTAVCFWQSVAKLSALDTTLLALIIIFVGWAHLLWSAELDVMHPQHEQYATVGMSLNNPNTRNSTIIAFLLSAVFAFCMYFIMGEGQTKAIVKIMLVAVVFLAARVYLYFTRIRLYYAEK